MPSRLTFSEAAAIVFDGPAFALLRVFSAFADCVRERDTRHVRVV
jgi:hypothetical protein